MNANQVAALLRDKGYEPIPVVGKVASSGWREVNDWDWDGATGVAVRLGRVVCVDIDVPDDDLAEKIIAGTWAITGQSPCRFGSKGAGLFYRCPDQTKKQKTGKSDKGEVEILASGQYVVLWGAHPLGGEYSTDVPIGEWPSVDTLPLITPERIGQVLRMGAELLGIEARTRKRTGRVPAKELQLMEVADRDDYQTWVQVGMMIGYHTSGAPYGLELWDTWSKASPKYQVGACAKKWDTFDHGREDGIRTISHLADSESWAVQVMRDDKDKVIANDYNLYVIARGHESLAGKLGYNERTTRKHWLGKAPWEVDGQFTDVDATSYAIWLQREIGITRAARTMAQYALDKVASERPFDPFRDWLEGLRWDGVARLEDWIPAVTGAENDVYNRAVGKRFLIAAVARAFQPGCKVDTVLVLVGEQGFYKSSAFEELVPSPEYYSCSAIAAGRLDKDAYMALHGPVVFELQEIDRYTKRGDWASEVKTYFSTAVDNVRKSYGREVVSYPRRCVIGATTNESSFLSDTTGNRRFWPVLVNEPVDKMALRENREQMWAEAVHLYRQGEQWWLTPEEDKEATAAQMMVTDQDPWCERVWEALVKGKPLTERGTIGTRTVHWYDSQIGEDGRLAWITTQQALTLIDEGHGANTGPGKRMQGVLRMVGLEHGNQLGGRHNAARGVRPWFIPDTIREIMPIIKK